MPITPNSSREDRLAHFNKMLSGNATIPYEAVRVWVLIYFPYLVTTPSSFDIYNTEEQTGGIVFW